MVGSLNGTQMLIGLAVGIILLIFLVLKTKIHAFLAMIICSLVIGIVGGFPVTDLVVDETTTLNLVTSIKNGFGNTMASVGIIIGFGVMMGQIFEASGAAKTMAHTFLKIFGKGREEAALAFTGFLVSIPVFCDSGFVILSPIAKSLSRVTKKSVIGLGVALASGLVITHSLVPPTPGPLGVCGIFGIDVGTFLLFALVLALPMAIVCIIYSKTLGKKYYQIPNEDGNFVSLDYQEPDYSQDLAAEDENLPGVAVSFAPLIVPILLILFATITSALGVSGTIGTVCNFIGQPVVALAVGLVISIYTLGQVMTRQEAIAEMEKGMASAGIILLLTGGGGALGKVIADSGLGTYMANGLATTGIPIVVLPLFISTAMRFIQGSGTVAMTTAASISAPIILATSANPVIAAIACCVGSLFFGYFNDSYFWVVNRTLGVSEAKNQIRIWSITSTLAWAVGVLEVIVLSFIF
ncbi:MAG: GntP family permease [Lachnospiraceae bacterium]|nr:GntP family permease [Lachnospiraceae bacterium]